MYCRLLLAIWCTFALYIGIEMIRRKENIVFKPQEGYTRYRNVFEVIYFALVAWYILAPETRLEIYLISIPIWLRAFGILIFIAGAALRIESQRKLGRMWSDEIRLLKNHRIVREGVYKYLRHPIYASYFLIAPGMFLITSDWVLGLAAAGYALLSFLRQPLEESIIELLDTRNLLQAVNEKAARERNLYGEVLRITKLDLYKLEFLHREMFRTLVLIENIKKQAALSIRLFGTVQEKIKTELSHQQFRLAMLIESKRGTLLAKVLSHGNKKENPRIPPFKSVLASVKAAVVVLIVILNLVGILDELVFAFTGNTFFM